PAPRERRSWVSCATVSPRYSVSTAALESWETLADLVDRRVLGLRGHGPSSRVSGDHRRRALTAIGARRRGTPRRRARGAKDEPGSELGPGHDAFVVPSTCAGRPELRGLRSHADVRRPAVLGGTAASVHGPGRRPAAGPRRRTAPPPE